MHPLTNPLLLPFGHLLFILFSLLVYAVTTHLTHQRRHPSAAFAWVLLLTLVPYAGLPLYLLVGLRKYARPLPRHRSTLPELPLPSDAHWAVSTLDGLGLPPPQANSHVVLHRDGTHALRELDQTIQSAHHTLDICTYVVGNDAVAHHVAQQLKAARARGVRIRLLIDAAGSWRTSRLFLRQLRADGIKIRLFMPLLHNPMRGRINLRNHRKLVVADGQRVWTGGRNLAQEYFLPHAGHAPWTDLTLTVQGPLAHDAQQLFNACWRRHRGHSTRHPAAPIVRRPTGMPPALVRACTQKPEPGDDAAAVSLRHVAQLVPSGPDLADDTVHSLLLTGLYQARTSVWAVTPYFVPDDSLLAALRLAATRGVDVNLILPRRSNHRIADIVREQALRDFAAAGGKVHLAHCMVHAKAVVIDDSLALAGSLNLDARSLFLNFELMVAFYSADDIARVQGWMTDLAGRCEPYALPEKTSLVRDIGQGLVRWLGFQI